MLGRSSRFDIYDLLLVHSTFLLFLTYSWLITTFWFCKYLNAASWISSSNSCTRNLLCYVPFHCALLLLCKCCALLRLLRLVFLLLIPPLLFSFFSLYFNFLFLTCGFSCCCYILSLLFVSALDQTLFSGEQEDSTLWILIEP